MARFRELVLIMRRYGNRRFPMAYFRYGWEPFQEAIIQKFSQALGGGDLSWLSNLAWHLRKLLFYIYFKKLTRLSYPCQFPNGWISNQAYFLIPDNREQKMLLIRGSTEEVPPQNIPMHLRIQINGKRVSKRRIDYRGTFEWRIPLATISHKSQFLEMKIISNKYNMRHSGEGNAENRFAFLLREIILI
jgi:hypothetical protein